MKLEGDHWTVNAYRGYVIRGGFGRNPENLCRFLRVILIWAPIRWFFYPKVKGGPPPCVILLLIAFLVGIVALMVLGVREVYVQQGISGFYPSTTAWYVTGAFMLLGASAIAGTGIYDLWKKTHGTAESGAMCPFIEVDGGLFDPPVIEDRTVTPEEAFFDKLHEALEVYEKRESNG